MPFMRQGSQSYSGFCIKKGMLVMGTPKKYLLAVLVVLIVIYIWSISIAPYRIPNGPDIVRTERTKQPYHGAGIPQSEVLYVHYPQPTTYSRIPNGPDIVRTERTKQPYHGAGIPQSEVLYVHYPQPTTDSRIPNGSDILRTERTKQPYHGAGIPQSEVLYVHYPQPTTDSRIPNGPDIVRTERTKQPYHGAGIPQSEVLYVHYPQPTTDSRIPNGPDIVRTERTKQPYPGVGIPQSEVLYVHHAQPTTYSRNKCQQTPVRFFAILSMQRSGSAWFVDLLNSHVNVSSNGEIFLVEERRSNISSIIKTLNKVYNLDWYNKASRKKKCIVAVGFKWMLDQGLMENHEDIVKYFNQRGVSVIFLFRRNLLRRFVSKLANSHDRSINQLNGAHKPHAHSKDEADILARYKPTIQVRSLVRDLKRADRWTADALEYFKSTRHTVLYYEDIVSNRTKLLDVLSFLGVPQRELVSHHLKIHTRPLPDQIENWKAVYKTLKRTQYKSFLHSD